YIASKSSRRLDRGSSSWPPRSNRPFPFVCAARGAGAGTAKPAGSVQHIAELYVVPGLCRSRFSLSQLPHACDVLPRTESPLVIAGRGCRVSDRLGNPGQWREFYFEQPGWLVRQRNGDQRMRIAGELDDAAERDAIVFAADRLGTDCSPHVVLG